MGPVLGLVPLFIPVSAFTAGPVSTALVSGRPGGLLDDGVRPVAGNLFHTWEMDAVIIHTLRPDKHRPDPGDTFSDSCANHVRVSCKPIHAFHVLSGTVGILPIKRRLCSIVLTY